MGELIAFLLVRVVKLAYSLITYSSVFVLGYYLNNELYEAYPDLVSSYGGYLWIITPYLVFCFIFLLKGMLIALRENRNWLWIFFLLVLIALTIPIPIAGAFFLTKDYLVNNYQTLDTIQVMVLSGCASLILAVLVYKKYKFREDIAPYISKWAYKAGFFFILKFYKNPRYTFCGKDESYMGLKLSKYLKDN